MEDTLGSLLSGGSMEVSELTWDLKSRLGLEDVSDVSIHVYRRRPGVTKGIGEYVASIPADNFSGPEDVARFGPGEYVLRPYKGGKYQSGSLSIQISEEAALAAGWKKPESQDGKGGVTIISPEFEVLKEQINALRTQTQQLEQSKDSIIAAAIQALAATTKQDPPPKSDSDGGFRSLVEFMIAQNERSEQRMREMMLQQQQSLQAMMLHQQQSMQEYVKLMTTMMNESSKASQNIVQALLTVSGQKREPNIAELLAAIAPFLNKGSAEELARSMVQMFQSGLNTAASLTGGSAEENIWQTLIKSLGPSLASGLMQAIVASKMAKEATGIAQPPAPGSMGTPNVPVPTQPPQGSPELGPVPTKTRLPEPKLEEAQQQPQEPNAGTARHEAGHHAGIDINSVLAGAMAGAPESVKTIFVLYVQSAIQSVGTIPQRVYEFVTNMLPAGVHQRIPDVKDLVSFDPSDPVDPQLLKFVWDSIVAEYEASEEAEGG